MTAIAGVFGIVLEHASDRSRVEGIDRVLDQMAARGASQKVVWREGGAALGVSRYHWEMGAGFSGPVLAVHDGDCVIAADASLYYRDDLRRRLARRGVRPAGQTPSHLIVAAYHAFGEHCTEELEGDFAFVLYDRRRIRVLCARDFGGKRPLHYAQVAPGILVVASTVGGVLAHPECPQDIDLAAVAEATATIVSPGSRTCYRAISRLDGGWTLSRERGQRVRVVSHWDPPLVETSSRMSFKDAAAELRALLSAAVAERVSQTGPTAVWMSGGRGSTAVFAAGQTALRSRGVSDGLYPVSVSYPPGDPDREDEHIASVAEFWQRPVRWVNAHDVPLLDRPAERAALRDEAYAHFYEGFNRVLARESLALGASVAFDGVGGDQLLLVAGSYPYELLISGRWLSLVREWRTGGVDVSGVRRFLRWVIRPAFPEVALMAGRFARGRHSFETESRPSVPEWCAPEFLRRQEAPEFKRILATRRPGETVAPGEARRRFADPTWDRVIGLIPQLALEEGVELRSPLCDRRLLAFAATRPRAERTRSAEAPRLLTHAMRGLLPDPVHAAPVGRAGGAAGYFDRAMRTLYARHVSEALESPLLARLGVIDRVALARGQARFVRSGEPDLGHRLFLTMQAELWLRARMEGADLPESGDASAVGLARAV